MGSPAKRSIENTRRVIPKKTGMRYSALLNTYLIIDTD